MTKRAWFSAIAIALAMAGCKKDDQAGRPPPQPVVKGEGAALDTAEPVAPDPGARAGRALPVSDIKGPAITPVVTSSITFVVPKDAGTWAELAFPCYAAAATMSGDGARPGAAFEQVSPLIPAAMAAANINLDTDITAIGGFACGEGPCIYVAAALKAPAKVKDALALIPGATVKDHGDLHYSFSTGGAKGPRTIHVRVLPVKWAGGNAPSDPWAAWQARTTHVIFLGGMMGGQQDLDPVTMIADPAAAVAKVKATESVAPDARGRCVIGTAGASADFKPGFKLDGARFAMAAPSGVGDPLTKLLGSTRTVDVEVELTLNPPPKDGDVKRWVTEGKAWMSQIAAPIRMQFAAQGPVVEMMIEMFGLIGERGFRPVVKGNTVTLSWRTDRVPQSDLDALERKFQSVLAP